VAGEPTGVGARAYRLRVSPVADARVRERAARLLAGRLASEGNVLRDASAEWGWWPRSLTDAEAAGLLRELYAAGVPPAAVVLLPLGSAEPGHGPDADAQRRFAVFAGRGGRFAPTWSWGAFVFGPLWYFRQGLYVTGAVLLVLGILPVWSLSITLLVSLALLVYCGVAGTWDEYLWKVKRTQWW
jgi:hypothetical protein